MDKLELRALARATARDSGLLELGDDGAADAERGRRRISVAPPPIDAIDDARARAACKPMGKLEYLVQSAEGGGRLRTLYVIVPDASLRPHLQRLGFEIEDGCRVLLDAASLVPVAVLRIARSTDDGAAPAVRPPSAGFNPYFEMPSS
ncbi:MAG TPA: hypothetical protein VNE58_08520 [Casimicrobiaceae bacterium]|nr:hypothetical protein [Casimicrobiaceae bacterium]